MKNIRLKNKYRDQDQTFSQTSLFFNIPKKYAYAINNKKSIFRETIIIISFNFQFHNDQNKVRFLVFYL